MNLLESNFMILVSDYFESNWHPIRHQWALCFINSFTFSIRTNNRLECINQKIKSVCSAFSHLQQFFEEFQTIISCLRVERDHIAMNCASNVSVKSLGSSVEAQYSQLLTPFAAKYITEQLHKMDKVKFVEGVVKDFETSSSTCSCYFNQTMKLPCSHIFAFRRRNDLPLFDEGLAHIRWYMSRYTSTCIDNSSQNYGESMGSVFVTATEVSKPKPKTQHQKYREAQAICSRLAQLVSECCGSEFESKIKELKRLQSLWEIGKTYETLEKDAEEPEACMFQGIISYVKNY